MRLLQSIAMHLILAILCFFIGGALLWDLIMAVVPSGIPIPDVWLWILWAGFSAILAYSIPSTVVQRRIRRWLGRLSLPRRHVSWEQGCRAVLSWLDSPLLFPWEQDQIAYDALREIEPYLRTEMSGEEAHRNLLKLLVQYPQAEEEHRRLLVESYLTQGIDNLDDAVVIANLWDDHPIDKLGNAWIDFALAQKIDAPWMDKGYQWAMEQGGPLEDKVARFLLPRLLSKNRYDDLATLVYIRGNKIEPSPELSRALLKIRQHHFRTSREDDLAARIREAVADLPEEERLEPVEKEVPLEELVSMVKPTFGGFVWRGVQSMFRAVMPILSAGLRLLFRGFRLLFELVWRQLERIEVPLSTKRWLYPIAIGALLAIIGWGVIQIVPSRSPETVSTDRSGLKVYHSDLPFTVQVAAFRTQAEAEDMMQRLRKSGEEAYWQKSEGEKPWYRVRVRAFRSQDDAKRYAENLLTRKLIDNYYVANFIDGYYTTP